MSYDFERELGIEERLEATHLRICPNCESSQVKTSYHDVTELGVTYSAPFRECAACGFGYTDSDYESAQAKALKGRAK